MFDIDTIDKSKFICFQLKDDSVYFGEVIYVDEKDDNQTKKPAKQKPIRQGFGIQLFGTSCAIFLSKYEGYWENDKRHGMCRCYYPDKAIYEGNMYYDVKEG